VRVRIGEVMRISDLTLSQVLDALHADPTLNTAQELKRDLTIFQHTQKLSSAALEVLDALFKRGPLEHGDLPSKTGRDDLLFVGFATSCVVKGKDGYNALTQDGYWAHKLYALTQKV
jgi:hypothetical protein